MNASLFTCIIKCPVCRQVIGRAPNIPEHDVDYYATSVPPEFFDHVRAHGTLGESDITVELQWQPQEFYESFIPKEYA